MKYSAPIVAALAFSANVAASPTWNLGQNVETPALAGAVDSANNARVHQADGMLKSMDSAHESEDMNTARDVDAANANNTPATSATSDAALSAAGIDFNAFAIPTLTSVLTPVTSLASQLTVAQTIAAAVATLKTAVTTDLAAINTFITTAGSNVFLQLGGIVGVTVNLASIVFALAQATATISNATLNAVATLDAPTLAALTSAINTLTTLLTSIGSVITKLLAVLAPSLATLISGLITGVFSILAPLLSPINSFGSTIVAASGGATSDGLTALQTALSNLSSTVTGLVG